MSIEQYENIVFKYWWLAPLYLILISHTILKMVFCICIAQTVVHTMCRLDVDLELVFALEQN